MTIDNMMDIMDYITQTKHRRHIVGGVLISVSLMLAGLAITIITSKEENYEE